MLQNRQHRIFQSFPRRDYDKIIRFDYLGFISALSKRIAEPRLVVVRGIRREGIINASYYEYPESRLATLSEYSLHINLIQTNFVLSFADSFNIRPKLIW